MSDKLDPSAHAALREARASGGAVEIIYELAIPLDADVPAANAAAAAALDGARAATGRREASHMVSAVAGKLKVTADAAFHDALVAQPQLCRAYADRKRPQPKAGPKI